MMAHVVSPVLSASRSIWQALDQAAASGEPVALVTVVGVNGSAPREAGARMVVWKDGRTAGTVGGGTLEFRAIAAARDAIATGRPARLSVHLTRDLGMCCGGAMELFIEPQSPVDRVILYGAGHVAAATARIFALLGCALEIVDAREEWNNPERFPGAALHTGDPRAHARALLPDARTSILILTHDHALDQDLVETLLPRPSAWIGLIGSRTKVAKFILRLRAAGMDEALFARLHGPVGLDIGALTPEEIAVSIAAEWVQHRRGKGTGQPMMLGALKQARSAGD